MRAQSPNHWTAREFPVGVLFHSFFLKHISFFFKVFFFLMWTIFKVFIEFVTILLLFYVLISWPQGM